MYARLRQGEVAEAFDAQAVPALEAGLAKYWYPQEAVRAVIAVDRGRTHAIISGWNDLLSAGVTVGFDDTSVHCELLMAAMAYGLEGEGFTLRGVAALLAALRAKGLFAPGSLGAPVVVCFDTQAPAGMEIVVPAEGTLTYVKGLLSNHPLNVAGEAGLRAAYTDYGHLNTVCRDAVRVLRRSVLRVRLYSSADGGEHQLFALLFIVLVTVCIASVVRRAMQKGVRRACLLLGALLLGWMTLRLLKYQLPSIGALNRYFWYSFYLFQWALLLTLLWLAWVIDIPEGRVMKPPKWFLYAAAPGGALVALVFTNELHNWAFRLDLSNPNWASEYGYGPVHTIFIVYCVLLTLAAMAMMLRKVRRNPRRGGVLFPLGFYLLLTVYLAAYAMRIPLAWESDMTMVVGVFILLFLETSIRAGMIPVNSKYKLLFTHSPLAMQIVDSEDKAALSSLAGPLRRDGDTLLFAAPIAGGRVLWQEDITALNRLHREVEASVGQLTAANAMLAREEKVKRAVEEENARTQLLAQLEAEIVGATARLSDMIGRREDAARIALLVCYIKRRCNLFFRGREMPQNEGSLPADELAVYMDELAEFAGYAGLRVAFAGQMQAPAELRRAILFYDVFYSAADWAVPGAGETGHMLASLGREGGRTTMRLQCPEGAAPFRAEEGLAEAIAAAGGAMEIKHLGDAVGINVSFSEKPPSSEGGGRRPGCVYG